MNIPTGSWCVVKRHIKDITSKGDIIKKNITQKDARRLALWYAHEDYHYWAMHIDSYNTPFAEGDKP